MPSFKQILVALAALAATQVYASPAAPQQLDDREAIATPTEEGAQLLPRDACLFGSMESHYPCPSGGSGSNYFCTSKSLCQCHDGGALPIAKCKCKYGSNGTPYCF